MSKFKPPPFYRPVEVELFNPTASFRQNAKEGNRYYVRFEITRELWELFEEPDAGLRLKGPLYRVYDDARDERPVEEKTDKPKKPPKLSGPHGLYWRQMVKAKYWAVPGVWKLLMGFDDLPADEKLADEMTSKALHELFSVETRADIAPADLEAWAEKGGVSGLITLSRNAAIKAEATNA